jgi:hypothetical protein
MTSALIEPAKGFLVEPTKGLRGSRITICTNKSVERGQDARNPDPSAIMEPIAHTLTASQVRAVAAYLNYLK